VPESFYLDLLSIPAYYATTSALAKDKCKIIEEYVCIDKIKQRITENLAGTVPTIMRDEYFCYCKHYSMAEAENLAVTTCASGSNDFILREAIDYLYSIGKSDVILLKILPQAKDSGKILMAIADTLYQAAEDWVEPLLVKHFRQTKDSHLLMRLIQMNSKFGLEYYIKEVTKKGRTFVQGNTIDDITEAICQINNPNLMPTLIKLIKARFKPNFQDRNVITLYSCLLAAITNCARSNFALVYKKISALKRKSGKNPELIGFCSNTLKRLEQMEKEKMRREYSFEKIDEIFKQLK